MAILAPALLFPRWAQIKWSCRWTRAAGGKFAQEKNLRRWTDCAIDTPGLSPSSARGGKSSCRSAGDGWTNWRIFWFQHRLGSSLKGSLKIWKWKFKRNAEPLVLSFKMSIPLQYTHIHQVFRCFITNTTELSFGLESQSQTNFTKNTATAVHF